MKDYRGTKEHGVVVDWGNAGLGMWLLDDSRKKKGNWKEHEGTRRIERKEGRTQLHVIFKGQMIYS